MPFFSLTIHTTLLLSFSTPILIDSYTKHSFSYMAFIFSYCHNSWTLTSYMQLFFRIHRILGPPCIESTRAASSASWDINSTSHLLPKFTNYLLELYQLLWVSQQLYFLQYNYGNWSSTKSVSSILVCIVNWSILSLLFTYDRTMSRRFKLYSSIF